MSKLRVLFAVNAFGLLSVTAPALGAAALDAAAPSTRAAAPTASVASSPGPGSVTGGGSHFCVLTGAGGAKCWGYGSSGGLGDGGTAHALTPVDVTGLTSGLSSIDAGGQSTCAVTDGGGVKCWGLNDFGQVGDGTQSNRLTPVDVSGLTAGVAAVAVGYYHACALTTRGGVECWGDNGHGQLGDGTFANSTTPVDVTGLTGGVVAIAAGLNDDHLDHTCALTSGGGVKCWGDNSYGQLGDGTTTTRPEPVDVVGLASGVAAIYAGGTHTCAVTTSGGAKCWGDNDGGQLGDGTTTTRLTPVDVSGLSSGVTDMALSQSSVHYGLGRSHTCAVAGGAVTCWGRNTEGEVGGGTSGTQRLVPTAVAGLGSGAVAVATAFWGSCAADSDGAVRCWGKNNTGDGTYDEHDTPVDVSGSFFRDECPTLLAVHSSFTLSDGYAAGSVATFVADPGYELTGDADLTCQADRTWDGPVPIPDSGGAVAVTPATGLSGGDVVTVALSGFQPMANLGWAQCLDVGLTPAQGNCAAPVGLGTADATGSISTSLRVARFIFVPNAARWVDCADPVEPCVIGAADTADVAGTATVAPISFAPPPPPPTVRGTVTLSPSPVLSPGDPVTVTGAGFRPSAFVQVFQCGPGPVDPSGCNAPAASVVADASGGFTTTIPAAGSVQPAGGSSMPCFETSEACVVAAAEAVDFTGTVATAPIRLVPTVIPGGATVVEGGPGTHVLDLPVTLSWASDEAVTVEWSTTFRVEWSELAAHPGDDYLPASGVVTFAPGEVMRTVAVTIVDDAVAEPGELLVVSFRNPTGARMGGFWGLGFGGVTDDD